VKKYLLLCFLTCSIILISGFVNKNEKKVPLPTSPLTVSIYPSINIKQGQTVFIRVLSKYKLKNPHIIFDNNKISMFNHKDRIYQGLIGIDALEKPGSHKVLIADSTGKLSEEKTLNIISGKFPVQNIVISGKKGGLEPTRDELIKVQHAKNALSDVNYWSFNNEGLNQAILPLNMPTKGCMISVYGVTRYHNGVPTGDYHKGIDIKAPQGQRINTITGGKVLIAEQFRLHGGTVAVDHGQGVVSIYLHMSKISVKEGEMVKTDQKVGEIGSTGFATGPHLHWGLYINGIPINPTDFWIKKVDMCS
jgi:murein DD-endopeptidase MepM/ murein hydrolase activator NlpD